MRGLCPILLLACLPLQLANAQSGLVEERISEENGFIDTCGEGRASILTTGRPKNFGINSADHPGVNQYVFSTLVCAHAPE